MNHPAVKKDLCTGDKKNIKLLYDTYFINAVLYANSIIKNEAEAKDISQNIFTKLWHKNLRFENQRHFKTYLYYSVRNACYDFLKQQKIVTEKIPEDFETSIEMSLIKLEMESELIREINLLPDSQQKVIKMRLNNMSIEDIAKELNVSQTTVKTHIKRGRKKLKEKLGPLYILILTTLINNSDVINYN